MKRNCESYKQKTARLWTWHPWFAWRRIRIHNEGSDDTCVWLEYVARRGKVTYASDPDYSWEYASILSLKDLINHTEEPRDGGGLLM
jgi:hypothetical protein